MLKPYRPPFSTMQLVYTTKENACMKKKKLVQMFVGDEYNCCRMYMEGIGWRKTIQK